MKKSKTMSSRKKVLFTIACFAVAFIALGGAAFGVYAALKHSLKHQFNVKYEVGENIAAKVTAYYQYEGDEEMTEISSITFNASDAEQSSNLTTDATNLTLGNGITTVRLIYKFENIGTQAFSVYATWDGIVDNLEDKDGDGIYNTTVGDTTNNKNVFVNSNKSEMVERITSFDLKALLETGISGIYSGESHYFYITISIANASEDAYCYSTAENGLSFALEMTDK